MELDLKNTIFDSCQILDSDFFNTNLMKANFEGSNLEGTRFDSCNLNEASFKNTKNYQIDINRNKVKNAKFSFPEVISLLDVFNIKIE